MIELRGEKVKSPERPMVVTPIKEPSVESRRVCEMVPYWPETASPGEIAKELGVKPLFVQRRIVSNQDYFKIFQHGQRFSRLKADYSNINEVPTKNQNRSTT